MAYINFPPGIRRIWFIDNTFLEILLDTTIYFADGVPAAYRSQGCIVNKVEDILPWITVLESKF
jgi:hypothetical protein